MTGSGRTSRRWTRPLVMVGGALVVVVVIIGVAVFALSHIFEANTSYGGPVSAEEIAENDNNLRDKPSYEATAEQLDNVLVSTSDALTTELPYLQFRWTRESTFLPCTESSALSYLSKNRVADTPIAEGDWDRALQIVIDHAAALGPVDTGAYHDVPGNRDTVIVAGGFSIQFGYDKATVLSGHAPCRLPQNVIEQTS